MVLAGSLGDTQCQVPEKTVAQTGTSDLALLTQPNFEQAARTVGISASTLYRWMNQAEFDAAWRALRRESRRWQTGTTSSRLCLERRSGSAVWCSCMTKPG